MGAPLGDGKAYAVIFLKPCGERSKAQNANIRQVKPKAHFLKAD